MSKKRERLEIIYDILKAIQDKGKDVRKTHILYRSNISTVMLKEYIDELISKGFISESEKKGRKIYNILEKGHGYIEEYTVIRSFVSSYGLD
jgi:predicted transcriptional regulator